MKYRICAHYCGTIVWLVSLGEFETKEEAEKVISMGVKGAVDGADDDYFYPDEMWVEEILPFDDPPETEWFEEDYIDDTMLF